MSDVHCVTTRGTVMFADAPPLDIKYVHVFLCTTAMAIRVFLVNII